MKIKHSIFILFLFIVSSISAQLIDNISSYKLQWKDAEKTYIDTRSIDILAFDGAVYPGSDYLPYFVKSINCEQNYNYEAEIRNSVYAPLTASENLIAIGKTFQSDVKVVPQYQMERNNRSVSFQILPIVSRDGVISKLVSFDLQITKIKSAQKISSAPLHSYAQSSVLSQGKFIKIKIVDSGIYKLTYDDLKSMGVDPANVKIFGYGGAVLEQNFMLPKIDDLPEIAIWMEKGTDGVFNSGDYILFYGQGVNSWKYNNSKSAYTHQLNTYSKYGYYFVTSDVGIGKKIQDRMDVLPGNAVVSNVDQFIDYKLFEKELTNIIQSGRTFYGEYFKETLSYKYSPEFTNLVPNSSSKAKLDVLALSSNGNNYFTLALGNNKKNLTVGSTTATDVSGLPASDTFTFTAPTTGNILDFNLTYSMPTSSSFGYLNYLEVNARRYLKMTGAVMPFQNNDDIGTNTYHQYLLSDANANVQVWDITDQQNIQRMTTERKNDKLAFTTTGAVEKRFIAVDPTASSSFSKPQVVGQIANQNLHAILQADLVIITHPDFVSQAETLANAHREKDNMTVSVVTTDQVYNEFSSGTPDATAYRWIMKMLYDRAAGDVTKMPKNLLLFGRGTYDNRKLFNSSGDNMVLTYQTENSWHETDSYITDDYFCQLNDSEGTNITGDKMDIGVGRFPVVSVQQAANVVDKTINYMKNTDKGDWKNQICLIGDDGNGTTHVDEANNVANLFNRSFNSYQTNKVYLDSYVQEISASGETYPLAKTKIMNLLHSGLFMINYTGHSSANGWANENIMSTADVRDLSNKHLPIWVAASCSYSRFDWGASISAGETVVLNSNGGGIGIFAAARTVTTGANNEMNMNFCSELFKKTSGRELSVGEALMSAKNQTSATFNKMSYCYLGDPAVRLNYPTDYSVATKSINGCEDLAKDTLKALSVVTVKGFIKDISGNIVSNFNGILRADVYDKQQKINTLRNDSDSRVFTYFDRPNIVFSGNVKAINGEFTVIFMMPKDMKYNFGTGRINYYAYDDVTGNEAQGLNEDFIVGGTVAKFISEEDGPELDIYLNSENFTTGDKVNSTPIFLANINDKSGINTVGSGIGHDLMLTIDKDLNSVYVLNDYYQAGTNSYTNGTVKYQMPELTEGKHSLTFRAWDLLNNSSQKTIEFEVVKGLAPNIYSVSNYPNPVVTGTNIVISHDRPETVLSATVEIFDLLGRKIWSLSQPTTEKVYWDLSSTTGVKVKAGIYLYRVSIKTTGSETSSKTKKMLIMETVK